MTTATDSNDRATLLWIIRDPGVKRKSPYVNAAATVRLIQAGLVAPPSTNGKLYATDAGRAAIKSGTADLAGYGRGYREQSLWLHGKALTEARLALESRLATVSDTPYNRGGTQATADCVARLEKSPGERALQVAAEAEAAAIRERAGRERAAHKEGSS